jgi:hypothetical protein
MYRPYFHALTLSTVALAFAAIAPPASAAQAVQRFNQSEQRDSYGRMTVEASVVTVLNCNGAGENGGQSYVYQYVKRAGFRAIQPPNWAQPIGGRDWSAYEQAVAAACGGGAAKPSGSNVSGTWRLSTDCGYTNPPWAATVNLSESANGSLSVTTSNDNLNTTLTGPPPAPDNWGTKMRPQVIGSTLTMAMHPRGWVSVLELTGTVNGSRIDGRIFHDDGNGKGGCNFTMVRQ